MLELDGDEGGMVEAVQTKVEEGGRKGGKEGFATSGSFVSPSISSLAVEVEKRARREDDGGVYAGMIEKGGEGVVGFDGEVVHRFGCGIRIGNLAIEIGDGADGGVEIAGAVMPRWRSSPGREEGGGRVENRARGSVRRERSLLEDDLPAAAAVQGEVLGGGVMGGHPGDEDGQAGLETHRGVGEKGAGDLAATDRVGEGAARRGAGGSH